MRIVYKFLVSMLFVTFVSAGLSALWGMLFVKREYEKRTEDMISFVSENISDAIQRYLVSTTSSIFLTIRKYRNMEHAERLRIMSDMLGSLENISFISDSELFVGDTSFLSFTKKRSGNEHEVEKEHEKGVEEGQKVENEREFEGKTIEEPSGKPKVEAILNGDFSDIFFLIGEHIVFSSDGITVAISTEPIRKILLSFAIGSGGEAFLQHSEKIGEDISSLIRVEDLNQRKTLTSYRRVENSDFFVAVSLPYTEVESIWRKILMQIVLFLSGTVAVAFILSFAVSRGITKPLEEMRKLAEKYSKFDFSDRVMTRRSDEVGHVIRAFSKMADEIERSWEELKRWNMELEKRVEERTAQLKKMHENLVVAEKMASVGVLGAGVAHEINNPLASSIGFIQIAFRKLQDEDVKKYLQRVLPNLERIRSIVSRLSYFAEVQMRAEYILIQPSDVIKEVIYEQITDDIKKGKEIGLELSETPSIYADYEQMKTALYEVIKNAFLASNSLVRVKLSCDEKNIFISIWDDGEKVDPEYSKRIFDAFFTLKKWEGVGLGLTIAKTVFTNIKGDIYLSDDLKTFIISVDIEKNREIKEFLKDELKIKTHLV